MSFDIHHSECVAFMRTLPDNSIDAIVTDPPYGLSFMGKRWDYDVPSEDVWRECLRVLKPGGHLLAFAGTRTQHRMAVRIEDAGFEIRDMIAWVYGSGFPKSLDVSKAIDRQRDDTEQVYQVTAWIRSARDAAGKSNRDIDDAFGFAGMAGHWTSTKSQPSVPTLDQIPKLLDVLGISLDDVPDEIRELIWTLNGNKGQPGAAWFEREVVGQGKRNMMTEGKNTYGTWNESGEFPITAPATDAAKTWQGWGTALKPALEPITVARKPFNGTVANNVLTWGTGGVNVGGCRVEYDGIVKHSARKSDGMQNHENPSGWRETARTANRPTTPTNLGRFPANLIHDGSDEVVGLFPDCKTTWVSPKHANNRNGDFLGELGHPGQQGFNDSGSAARFFYCAKASKRDRDEGCEGMPQSVQQSVAHGDKQYGTLPYTNEPREMNPRPRANNHPTVKPTDLMRYLCRLVTPPGGTVLDPFMGSGSTGKAAVLEGFNFIGCDMTAEYVDIARARITHAFNSQPNKLDL